MKEVDLPKRVQEKIQFHMKKIVVLVQITLKIAILCYLHEKIMQSWRNLALFRCTHRYFASIFVNLSYDIHDDGVNGTSFIVFYVEIKLYNGGNTESEAQDSIKSNILIKNNSWTPWKHVDNGLEVCENQFLLT